MDHPPAAVAMRLAAARERLLHDPRPGTIEVAVAAGPDAVTLVLPLTPGDAIAGPGADRARRVAATGAGALATAGDLRPPTSGADTALEAAVWRTLLALVLPSDEPVDAAELMGLALEEQSAALDRVRLVAVPVDPALELEPCDAPAWLWEAEMAARLGAAPGATRVPMEVAAAIGALRSSRPAPPPAGVGSPHADPLPARRALRRILQRLDGMGKYGGFHTEFRHLGRGFRGDERALALEAGEALLRAGMLTEKPSVGQRHVSLVAARTADIRRLVERGDTDDPELLQFVAARR